MIGLRSLSPNPSPLKGEGSVVCACGAKLGRAAR
jgi:hypothetical protein